MRSTAPCAEPAASAPVETATSASPAIRPETRDGENGLRVAMFSNNYRPRISGVAVAVDFLERALRSEGHRTLVVAPDYEGTDPDRRDRVLRVRSLPLKRWNAALPLPDRAALRDRIAQFRPDVLHTHHPFLLGRSAAAISARLRLPLVATFHTFYEAFLQPLHLNHPPLVGWVRDAVLRYLRRCDLVVAPTEPVRAWLEAELGPTVATAAAPTGIDASRFRPLAADERSAIRARFGVSAGTALLVWAGRVTPEKSPELAVEALAALRERGRDAALLVLGRGPGEAALRRRARDLGLDERVIREGFVEPAQLPAYLAAGDLYLFTSWTDTQAIVAYEAWAAGLRVVSVRSLAGRALVDAGANGLLAEHDGGAFADAIGALLSDPESCRMPFPAERFGPAAIGTLWSRIYGEAIARAEARCVDPFSTPIAHAERAPLARPIPAPRRAAEEPAASSGSATL